MSGDLRKPSKSIPRGTLAGMAVTFVSYLLVVLGLGATTRRHSLYHNYSILQEISFFPPIIALAALFTAFTSTLTSIVVSSKVLQAIGRDAIVPLFSPFGYGGAKTDEPYLAYTASYLLCQLSLFAGDVNVVAPFVTMFYLLTFTIINMACFLLKVSSAPNFRPSFQYFKWWTALLGMLVSCFIMVMVNGLAASLSFLVVYVLFLVIHYTTPPKAWGDVTQSLIYHQVRKFLLRLDARKEHVKFWRPQILLLVHNPRGSYHLIKFCNSLKKGGLYILGHILKGDFQEHLLELRHQQQAWLRFVDVTEIKAFVDITISDSERVGARNLILGCGLGGMRPNIVVMGLYNLGGYRYRLRFHREEDSDSDISDDSYDSALNAVDLPTDQIELETSMSVQDYVCIIEDMMVIRKAVALAYGFNRLHRTCPPPSDSWWSWLYEPSDKKYIDLWPIQMAVDQVGTDATATRVTTANFDSYTMVLQLGTILHMAPYWRTHFTLRVMCFVEHEQDVAEEHRRVASLLESLRIKAVLKVLHLDNGQVATYDLIVQGDASRVETEAVNKLHAVLDQSHDPRSPTAPDTDLESYMCNPVAIPPATPAPTTSSAESHQHPMSAAGDQSSSYLARSRIDFHVPDRLEVAQPNHDTSQRTHDLISQLQRQAGPQGPTASMRIAVPQANGGPLHGTQGLSSSSSSDSEDYWLDWDVDPALSIWGAMDIARDPLPGNETTIVAMDDSPVATPLDHPGSPGVLAPSSPCTAQPSPLPSATHPRQRLEFNDLSSRAQNIIINNLIQLHSKDTAVVFTTLPIPTPGTHQSEESSVQYIEDIELLVNGLPPTLLVHSSSLTVTTSL
ncbi:hypothetical protein H4R35_004822 [Dimargaris xerosporica]|nr:hypothetical protein H4R35_004822 [Dimargaris xerosporica]